MGVGLALFLEGGEVTYHNLWLPGRFPLLFVYVARKGDWSSYKSHRAAEPGYCVYFKNVHKLPVPTLQ